jgi:hypothetical protein
MSKKFFYTIFFSFVLLLANFITAPSNAKGVEVWKSETNQSIKRGKWTTLKFGNRAAMEPKGSRSFYCAQVHLNIPKKNKPKWVKIRFARVLPNGKLDSTGTNTWVLGKRSPASWQGSTCWPINPDYPVVAQVKYGGGPKSITSPLRQFKSWNPNIEIEDTLFVFN